VILGNARLIRVGGPENPTGHWPKAQARAHGRGVAALRGAAPLLHAALLESRLCRPSREAVGLARAPLQVDPTRCLRGTLTRTPVRQARRLVRAARSSASSCRPPILRPTGPVAAALGFAGSPGFAARALASRQGVVLGRWRRWGHGRAPTQGRRCPGAHCVDMTCEAKARPRHRLESESSGGSGRRKERRGSRRLLGGCFSTNRLVS
jgi:hypothetical protein